MSDRLGAGDRLLRLGLVTAAILFAIILLVCFWVVEVFEAVMPASK